MHTYSELPKAYQALVDRNKIISDRSVVNIDSLFPWANSFEGPAFWKAVDKATEADELPDIPDLRYNSFEKRYLAYISINLDYISLKLNARWRGMADVYESSEGEYHYFVRLGENRPVKDITTYHKFIVNIKNILKCYE